MDDILLCIDGTGPVLDDSYYAAMHNSFVSYIYRRSSARSKQYLRGPGFDGSDMSILVRNGYEFVHLNRFVKPDSRVLLAGYSRGGAAVVAIAARLKRDGVPVHGMMLFDPVDRSPLLDTNEIPTNVELAYKALRDPSTFSRVSVTARCS